MCGFTRINDISPLIFYRPLSYFRPPLHSLNNPSTPLLFPLLHPFPSPNTIPFPTTTLLPPLFHFTDPSSLTPSLYYVTPLPSLSLSSFISLTSFISLSLSSLFSLCALQLCRLSPLLTFLSSILFFYSASPSCISSRVFLVAFLRILPSIPIRVGCF